LVKEGILQLFLSNNQCKIKFTKIAKVSLVLGIPGFVAGVVVRMTAVGMGCQIGQCFGYYYPLQIFSELKWQPEGI